MTEPTSQALASHPRAAVPERLLDDPTAEKRWRARFSATRASLPVPARDNPDRALFVANPGGRFEVYCWDVPTGRWLQGTDRPEGTVHGTLSANGQGLWWFDDAAGNEFGGWSAQPFGSAPGSAGEALPGVPHGYPAGLEVGVDVVLAGFNDDDGTRVHLARSGAPISTVYRHETDGGVAALSKDEQLWVLAHTEHGDARYPALRSYRVSDGQVLAELDDTPGKGLSVLDISPVAGDQRALVTHERRGRDELLIWDAERGDVTELEIDLPGDLAGCFFHDALSILVLHTHQGRSTLHQYELSSGRLRDIPVPHGIIDGAITRPDGGVWFRSSSGSAPAQSWQLSADAVHAQIPGAAEELLVPPGAPTPGSEPLTDLRVAGPGGEIHAFLAVPADADRPDLAGLSNTPLPTVFLVHGGPAAADEDSFDAERAAWLDAGFAVVQVNYRGSTGYGSAWRDALSERVGHTELADIAAVQDYLIARGIADQDRCVIVGASWGGFLTLLALGAQPSRWAAGVAGVPVADYVASYAQQMEPLRAYDDAIFGGSPTQVPAKYADSSPLSWVDGIQSPVLVLAGANDPRCPLGQIENYLAALQRKGKQYAVYAYDAGHGSMVVQERIRQVAVAIGFVLDALGRPAAAAGAPAAGSDARRS